MPMPVSTPSSAEPCPSCPSSEIHQVHKHLEKFGSLKRPDRKQTTVLGLVFHSLWLALFPVLFLVALRSWWVVIVAIFWPTAIFPGAYIHSFIQERRRDAGP